MAKMELVINGTAKQLKAFKQNLKGADVKESKVGNKYTEWYKEAGLTIVKKDFTVKLSTKKGEKVYKAVELSNGKTAVYTMGGRVLKYAW